MPRITKETILKATYGPLCSAGCGKRTRNPSKTCSDCLGARACYSCRGTGVQRPPHELYACLECPGTGLKE